MGKNACVIITITICTTIAVVVGMLCLTSIESTRLTTFHDVEMEKAKRIVVGDEYWRGAFQGIQSVIGKDK